MENRRYLAVRRLLTFLESERVDSSCRLISNTTAEHLHALRTKASNASSGQREQQSSGYKRCVLGSSATSGLFPYSLTSSWTEKNILTYCIVLTPSMSRKWLLPSLHDIPNTLSTLGPKNGITIYRLRRLIINRSVSTNKGVSRNWLRDSTHCTCVGPGVATCGHFLPHYRWRSVITTLWTDSHISGLARVG